MKKAKLLAHIEPEKKERFRAVAAAYGVSESALLGRLIDRALDGKGDAAGASGEAEVESSEVAVKTRRLNLRISDAEHNRLAEAAKRFGTSRNSFVTSAVRAAMGLKPELLREELVALNDATMALDAAGRNLNQIARRLNSDRQHAALFKRDLEVIAAVTVEIKRVSRGAAAFTKAAVERWA